MPEIQLRRQAPTILVVDDNVENALLMRDLLATKGIPTRWGSPAHADQVFDYDAVIVERLRDVGCVKKTRTCPPSPPSGRL